MQMEALEREVANLYVVQGPQPPSLSWNRNPLFLFTLRPSLESLSSPVHKLMYPVFVMQMEALEREVADLRAGARAPAAGASGGPFSLGGRLDVLSSLGLDKWREERLRAASGDIESGASKKTDDAVEPSGR